MQLHVSQDAGCNGPSDAYPGKGGDKGVPENQAYNGNVFFSKMLEWGSCCWVVAVDLMVA
jgi:hypothetical protein